MADRGNVADVADALGQGCTVQIAADGEMMLTAQREPVVDVAKNVVNRRVCLLAITQMMPA